MALNCKSSQQNRRPFNTTDWVIIIDKKKKKNKKIYLLLYNAMESEQPFGNIYASQGWMFGYSERK